MPARPSRSTAPPAVLLALVLIGCAHGAKSRAAEVLRCPEEQLVVTVIDEPPPPGSDVAARAGGCLLGGACALPFALCGSPAAAGVAANAGAGAVGSAQPIRS